MVTWPYMTYVTIILAGFALESAIITMKQVVHSIKNERCEGHIRNGSYNGSSLAFKDNKITKSKYTITRLTDLLTTYIF